MTNGDRWATDYPELRRTQGATKHKSLAQPTPRKSKPAPTPLRKPERAGDVMSFTVIGEPMGAPRMTRSDKWKQRPCVMRYREWKDKILKAAGGERLDGSQIKSLSWQAYFAPPESWSKKKRREAIRQPHRSKPDRDNIDKAILDALFKNDAGVHSGSISKSYDEPARLEIQIEYE